MPVTDSDVLRLAVSSGKAIEDFVCFYGETEVDLDLDGGYVIQFSDSWAVMGLRRENGACVFQTDNRCSVYKARPYSCRSFPLAIFLDESGEICDMSFIDGVDCKRVRGKKKQLKSIRNLARREDEADYVYYEKVREWNENVQTNDRREFLRFMFGSNNL